MSIVSFEMVVEVFTSPYFILEARKNHQVKFPSLEERGNI